MSAYVAGVEAYRSTVKWLVAFVPTATVTAGLIVAGPVVVDRVSAEGVGPLIASWFAVGGAFIVAGLVGIVAVGLHVLSTQAQDLAAIPTEDLDQAFGAGVGAPYFTDSAAYVETASEAQVWFDYKRTQATGSSIPGALTPLEPSEDELKALAGAEAAVRDWELHRRTTGRFRCFIWVFWAASASMLLGLLMVASVELEPAARRDPPVPVTVEVTDERFAELVERTGCDFSSRAELSRASVWLVAGDFDEPTLQVDGDGCALDLDWVPGAGVNVRPIRD